MSAPRDLGACVYCGRAAQELHHFTASLVGTESHLDPAATIPLCVSCHKAEHAAWRAVGLDRMDHPVVARAARVPWLLGRLVELDRPVEPATLRAVHGVLIVLRDGVAALVHEEAA